MRAILLVIVLVPVSTQAEVVSLKKTDGTTVEGEYIGTKRDGTTVSLQLKVGDEIEEHPLTDFTVSAKKKITRLNRLIRAQANKVVADAEKAEKQKKAAKKAEVLAAQKKALAEAFPPEIEQHNTEVIERLRAQGVIGSIFGASDDATQTRTEGFMALAAVVYAYAERKVKLTDPTLKEQSLENVMASLASSREYKQVKIAVNEVLDAGADELLVKPPGEEQQTWREVWAKCVRLNAARPVKDLLAVLLPPQAKKHEAPGNEWLRDGDVLNTLLPPVIHRHNSLTTLQIFAPPLHHGDLNEAYRTGQLDAFHRLQEIVVVHAGASIKPGAPALEKMLSSLTAPEIIFIHELLLRGAGELLVKPADKEPQKWMDVWSNCMETGVVGTCATGVAELDGFVMELWVRTTDSPETASHNLEVLKGLQRETLEAGKNDSPIRTAAFQKLVLYVWASVVDEALASRAVTDMKKLLAAPEAPDVKIDLVDLEKLLVPLTPPEIAEINAIVEAGAGEFLVKFGGMEQMTWRQVWSSCLEIKAELP